jgi:hypothetical protein
MVESQSALVFFEGDRVVLASESVSSRVGQSLAVVPIIGTHRSEPLSGCAEFSASSCSGGGR